MILIKSLRNVSFARYSSNYRRRHCKMVASLFTSLGIIFLYILLCIQRMQSVSRTCLGNSIIVESLPNCSPARYSPKYNRGLMTRWAIGGGEAWHYLIGSIGRNVSFARYSSNYCRRHCKMVASLFTRLGIIFLYILLCIQRMQSVSRTCLGNSIIVESLPNCSPVRYSPKYNRGLMTRWAIGGGEAWHYLIG